MANAIRSTPAIHWKCEQNIVAKCMYTAQGILLMVDILDDSLKFQNRMFISFPQFVYCLRNYLSYSRLMAVLYMGSIQQLLCTTFMTPQSRLIAALLRHVFRGCLDVLDRDLVVVKNSQFINLIGINIWIEIQLIKTANRMAKIVTFSLS